LHRLRSQKDRDGTAMTDWFERLTGFRERDYEATRERLAVEADVLVSRVSGQRWGIGRLEVPTLGALRARTKSSGSSAGRTTLAAEVGEARALHADPRFAGALFQVASQFNLLEMIGPEITPEHGVTRYAEDGTQGPACAMAAGAATIYRNYFVPVCDAVGVHVGQRHDRQIDGLQALGAALAQRLDRTVNALWTMRNGYALASRDGLTAIAAHLADCSEAEHDALRVLLAIGVQHNTQVTDLDPAQARINVSQAFCSALPLGYSALPAALWAPLARLVLEATYEATLRAGIAQAAAGGSNIVLLTRVGGGAFANPDAWIDAAIHRALALDDVAGAGLDVRLVCFRRIDEAARRLIAAHGAAL
jgi:hypothetical protein